jgi:hypothetical protein
MRLLVLPEMQMAHCALAAEKPELEFLARGRVPVAEKQSVFALDVEKTKGPNMSAIITRTHIYREMTEDMRPQDPDMDGRGWTFETLEHGGKYPDMMPQAIRATDAEGRSCIYAPVSVHGEVVDSIAFGLETKEQT